MSEHVGLISVRDEEVGGFKSALAQPPGSAELLAEFLTEMIIAALLRSGVRCSLRSPYL